MHDIGLQAGQVMLADAFRRAHVTGVEQLDGIETHDCFTTSEYMAIDHFGLTPPNELAEAIHAGRIEQRRVIELAPVVLAEAADDAVAAEIVQHLSAEVVALARVTLLVSFAGLAAATRFQNEAQAGLLHVNSQTAGADVHVPFGGIKAPRSRRVRSARAFSRARASPSSASWLK